MSCLSMHSARRKKSGLLQSLCLTNDDERKTISFSETKRRQLTKRRGDLNNIRLHRSSFHLTLDRRVGCGDKKQIASLSRSIRVIEQELESLDLLPK